MLELIVALGHVASLALLVAAFVAVCRTYRPPGAIEVRTSEDDTHEKT